MILSLCAITLADATTSALINKQLDTQQKLSLDTVLPKAMDQIADQTGVRIEADPSVWDLLPWGQQTNISVKIDHRTLREALDGITRKLGLTWQLGDESIKLQPLPALRRIGRRSTVQELQMLDFLYSTELNPQNNRPTLHEFLSALDARLQAEKSSIAIENRAPDSAQNLFINLPRNSSIAESLEQMVHQTSASWYPWGRAIVVVSKHEQIENQLAGTVTARYDGVDVGQVLLEIFARAGVSFTVDPRAYQAIPPSDRTIRLVLDDASIQQALQTIAGYTGLSFTVTDTGVRVSNSIASTLPATDTPGR